MANSALTTMKAVARQAQGLPYPIEPGWRAAWARLMMGAKARRELDEARGQWKADGFFHVDLLTLLDAACQLADSVADGDPPGLAGRLEVALERVRAIPTRFAAVEAAKQACAFVVSQDPALGMGLPAMVASLSAMDLQPDERLCVVFAQEAMMVASRGREQFTVEDCLTGALAGQMNQVLSSDFHRMRVGRARAAEQSEELDLATPRAMALESEGGPRRI